MQVDLKTQIQTIWQDTNDYNVKQDGHHRQKEEDEVDNNDDWFLEEEDHQDVNDFQNIKSHEIDQVMIGLDSAKLKNQFHDIGYREGITAGKQNQLQIGFDQGFNQIGTIFGRKVGNLKGQINALLLILDQSVVEEEQEQERVVVGVRRGTRKFTKNPSLGLGFNSNSKTLETLKTLQIELDSITVTQLATPDYEAIQHELEHQAEQKQVIRESKEQQVKRESILKNLESKLEQVFRSIGFESS